MSTAQLRESLKQRACETIDRLKNDLEAISHDIHAHPEENFEEHHAHKLLTEAIADNGHKVTRKAYGLDTAFESTIGTQGATVAPCVPIVDSNAVSSPYALRVTLCPLSAIASVSNLCA